MSFFGFFPAASLLCAVPFVALVLGCGANTETAVSRLPFQEFVQQSSAARGSPGGLPLGRASASGQVARSQTARDQTAITQTARAQVPSAQVSSAQVPSDQAAITQPAQLEVVRSFEQAMAAYRAARSQPVQPEFPLLALTHTPATTAELGASLRRQLDNGLALRYPAGQAFTGRYSDVSIASGPADGTASGTASALTTASVSGCTRYQAVEFDSSSGSDLAEFDETVSFVAQLVLDPDEVWLLDSYVSLPLDVWGKEHC